MTHNEIKVMETLDGDLEWMVTPQDDGDVAVHITHKEFDEKYENVKDEEEFVLQVITDFLMAKVGDDEMSNTEYATNHGEICPVCESPEVYGDNGSNSKMCESCGAKWIEAIKIMGYKNLTKGDE